MKLYRNYMILILVLALVLNWMVKSENTMEKVDLNLRLIPKVSILCIEALQAILLARLLVLYPKNRTLSGILWCVAAYCVFEFFIIKGVKAHLITWISGIRYYFSFLPLFLLSCILAANGYQLKKELHWLVGLSLLQVPVVIYQYMNLHKVTIINDRQLLYDMLSGTMGGIAPNLMALVVCIGWLYFMIRFFEEKKALYVVISILLVLPTILAEAKGMFVLLFLLSFYLAVVFKVNSTKLLMLGLAAGIMILGFEYLYEFLGYNRKTPLDVEFLVNYAENITGGGRLSRIESITHSFTVLNDNNALLTGLGIGNANKGAVGDDGQFYNFYTIRHSLDILITETGLLGLGFFLFILFTFFRISLFLLRHKSIQANPQDLLLTRLFLGLLLVFVFGLFWVDVLFRVQFMYPFGMLAGYQLGLYKKIKAGAPAPGRVLTIAAPITL